MPVSPLARRADSVARHIPGLRRLPVMYLLIAGEILMLLRNHIERLEPRERRRLLTLLRSARGRPSNLSDRERKEFSRLIAKAEPMLFAASAASKLSPVKVPKRVLRGRG